MKQSFELSHYRRANVWIDETPPAEFSAVSVLTQLANPKSPVSATSRMAGAEICVPYGPMTSYGLLGAELINVDADAFKVIVSVNDAGRAYGSSLTSMSDEVKVGLLDEYARAVVDGVVAAAEAIGAPRRTELQFRWAAHGIVGSSRSLFKKLGVVVLQLLMLPKEVSEGQVRQLFE